MKLRQAILASSVAAAAAALAGLAMAQAPRSGGGGELQKFMQQYQQVSAEKTALQAQVTQLQTDLTTSKAELAAVKKERDALKSHTGASSAEVAQLTTAKTTAEHSLEQYKERMNELVEKFRQLAQTLKDTENNRVQVRRELDERSTQFDKCALDNVQLYEITGEVLDRYEHVGLFTRVSASEPFTKITRTRIDNLVDDYRERAQALRVKKQPKP
jgi:DNA repair exonuclease SbcCD ATPase subunit